MINAQIQLLKNKLKGSPQKGEIELQEESKNFTE